MFQREVAERIVAKPDSEALRPAVGAGAVAHDGEDPVRRVAQRLRAAAEGHLAHRAPGTARRAGRARGLRRSGSVTAAAFGQRRKMLRQSLKSLAPDAEALARDARASIPPRGRNSFPLRNSRRFRASRTAPSARH